MDVPWEVIIKIYRKKLGKRKFDTLKQYAEHFISFLEEENPLFPEEQQKEHFYNTIVALFDFLNNIIEERVSLILSEEGKIQNEQIENIVVSVIKENSRIFEEDDLLPSIPESHAQEIIDRYRELIEKARNVVFEELPIPETLFNELEKICGNFFCKKDTFYTSFSGVAIAGFGENEAFPSLTSFIVEAKVNNRLKYLQDRSAEINFNKTALIVPFAQTEMVYTFMEGIDPLYHSSLEGYLNELFNNYPSIMVESISQLSDSEKQELVENLRKVGDSILSDFKEEMRKYRIEKHINPIVHAVAVLPKDELAEMAEALVSLTSFKQKISMDVQTVGGPIDVAVISKGDGFIWIKRKHYFKPELNSYFFANYYREDQD